MTQELKKLAVWLKGYPIQNISSNVLRSDAYGNYIAFDEYGKISKYGWEIDHIYPKSRGGSDDLYNLRPLSTHANRVKGDRLPY